MTCMCGTNLISDGKTWTCPMRGSRTAMDEDKTTHVGVIPVGLDGHVSELKDRRIGVQR